MLNLWWLLWQTRVADVVVVNIACHDVDSRWRSWCLRSDSCDHSTLLWIRVPVCRRDLPSASTWTRPSQIRSVEWFLFGVLWMMKYILLWFCPVPACPVTRKWPAVKWICYRRRLCGWFPIIDIQFDSRPWKGRWAPCLCCSWSGATLP